MAIPTSSALHRQVLAKAKLRLLSLKHQRGVNASSVARDPLILLFVKSPHAQRWLSLLEGLLLSASKRFCLQSHKVAIRIPAASVFNSTSGSAKEIQTAEIHPPAFYDWLDLSRSPAVQFRVQARG